MIFTTAGIEGSGKSTASVAIAEACEIMGQPYIPAREPGGTPIAEKIRDFVLSNDTTSNHGEEFDPKTELLLMFASRNQLWRALILPHLKKGYAAIIDRSHYCSFAMQVRGRDTISVSDYDHLMSVVMADMPVYDLIFHLHTDTVEESLRRRWGESEPDRFESSPLSYFERVNDGYFEILEGRQNVVRINTSTHDQDAVRDIVIRETTRVIKQAKGAA